ncbi:MAG: MBL fold hydrolase [Candidatus Taylorbacteria bacterium CG10_big_fil_rev_8_21_14_0_10_41_48]|uniref:MBL fold hydrolase n=1 Tax=Candidatus Taylorbacteria bacterium CG10_big_fil_rev_8_21_14_0_10_41_48 TaxID=1975024 RepID=A0A2M8LCT1_9BACT|nr:MAG: MBL fold hydrolase [Candidatus Taylorbacteria bacterium CG10_big_fil_rev_8_21_14_0_10_41_48]
MSKTTLTCCGAVGNATGANFWLQASSLSILVDCGLVQGSSFAMSENRDAFPYDVTKVDFLLITHAHMDHIGRIPKLAREGFSGTIYSTPETREIAEIMLADARGLIEREAKESGQPVLYESIDIEKALSLWKTVGYHEKLDLSSDISIYLRDAGHVLGSSIIELSIQSEAKKIAFTGDLGNSPTPLLRDTEYVTDADYMVIESVYGDRNHEPKDLRDAKLRQVIDDTVRRGGTVVIPTFSLERTQVILYEINNFIEEGKISRVPVYLDSPLATKITGVYKKHEKQFKESIQKEIMEGDDIFDFPGLKIVRTPDESASLDRQREPKIILAGSGMSVGGRVLHHERSYLTDPKSTILLVGYQVPGSLGRQIEEQRKHVSVDGARVDIHAHIEKIGGFSSHKDSNNLVEFASHTQPKMKKVFVAMGETKSSSFLAQRLRGELGLDAIVPEKNKEYEI